MLEENKSKRRQAYIDIVNQEEPETLKVFYKKSKLQLILGAKDFLDDIRQKYYDKLTIKEMPQVKELFRDKVQIEKALSCFYQIEVDELLKTRRGNSNEARIKQAMDRNKKLRQRITAVEKLLKRHDPMLLT